MHAVKGGFSLAELLIALLILGVISVFTIPKVLQVQKDRRNMAIAREAMGTITQALEEHRRQGLLTNATVAKELTPYMNYVSVDTVSILDSSDNRPCAGSNGLSLCLRLHNGALLFASNGQFGNGPDPAKNATMFWLDPDGQYTGNLDVLMLYLYINGRIVTRENITPNSYYNGATITNPCAACNPTWYKEG